MRTSIQIDGMSCQHCVHAVRRALESLDGVTVESVEIGSAVIVLDNPDNAMDRVKAAIDEEGYDVVGHAAL